MMGMTRRSAHRFALLAALFGAPAWMLVAPGAALAAIPAGYQGKPFDPAVVGGVGIIPAIVKAGPYQLPGRLDLANYDMGGDNVGFKTEAHYTTKGGDGYRTDRPTATMCLTAQSKPDVWYDTSAAQDGSFYPSPTTDDFYIGSVHPNDWFNYTVDVQTAGVYALSANFSTGNGPPGGEGGDGQMELVISVNGTKMADWKATFPDFENKANFHNWRAYPNFAMLTLEAGVQVIRIDLPFKHLNLDYLQFDLMGGGGSGSGGAGGSGGGGASTAGTSGTAIGTAGASSGVAGTPNGGSSGASSSAGAPTTGGAGSAGTSAGSTGSLQPTTPSADEAGCGCRLAATQQTDSKAAFALLGLGLFARARRRQTRMHLRRN